MIESLLKDIDLLIFSSMLIVVKSIKVFLLENGSDTVDSDERVAMLPNRIKIAD